LRMTRIFAVASLGVLVFGIIAGQQLHELGQAWLTVAMTLFVVALVLLVLIMRDQRRAIVSLGHAAENEALVAANSTPPPVSGTAPAAEGPAAGAAAAAGPGPATA